MILLQYMNILCVTACKKLQTKRLTFYNTKFLGKLSISRIQQVRVFILLPRLNDAHTTAIWRRYKYLKCLYLSMFCNGRTVLFCSVLFCSHSTTVAKLVALFTYVVAVGLVRHQTTLKFPHLQPVFMSWRITQQLWLLISVIYPGETESDTKVFSDKFIKCSYIVLLRPSKICIY